MSKGKENSEYLELASQVVNTMKEHITNELNMNVALSETQKNVSTYIRKNTKPNTQKIEFKTIKEFDDFKKSFVYTSKEKIDQPTLRLKQVLDDLTPENVDKTKSELDKIRQSINTEKEVAQKRLALAGEIANTMLEFIKNNNQNEGTLRAKGAQAAFLEKGQKFLSGEGKINFLNNQDLNKFKAHIDSLVGALDSSNINKINDLKEAMDSVAKGDIGYGQQKLQAVTKNPLEFDKKNNSKEKSKKVGKRIKRAFKSAKATVKDIGSSISSKVSELKESATKTGKEWKEKIKTQVNTWRNK